MTENDLRLIAFYLPQFHPIPENDEWWGRGFTEWTNVVKARPLFPDHYQPHLPADLGFYDLRASETREAQADLARQYGIRGFCYYHYWFNGRKILERPFNEVLSSHYPNYPFCLCWANENWTRTWDGSDHQILLEQKYSIDDDINHIRSLLPAFRDERYIRVDGKPLFLVYRTGLLPGPKNTADIWRNEARRAGIKDLYLVRVESFGDSGNPEDIGFDATVEFAPFNGAWGKRIFGGNTHKLLAKLGLLAPGYIENRVFSYQSMARSMLNRPTPPFKRFHCVTPSWDNSARKKNAYIFYDSTPEKYENWLKEVVIRTKVRFTGDERIVFVNAWNEWAEGNHLEPDQKWGHAYLEATQRALSVEQQAMSLLESYKPALSPLIKSPFRSCYWKAKEVLAEQVELIKVMTRRKY